MNDTNRPNTAVQAARCLARLGTNAVPPLLAAVANAHHPVPRAVLLDALGTIPHLGQAAQQVVPVVASCLNPANNRNVHTSAIGILGKLRAVPEISVPALASGLKNPDPWVREYSVHTLATFGPQASAAIPALTNALVNPDSLFRRKVAWALYQIDPLTFPDPYGQ